MNEMAAIYEVKSPVKSMIDEKTIEDFLFTTETKLNDKQKAMFLAMAKRNNLDPFKREIHVISFGSNFNVVTGYQVYIQRAEATGLLNGWKAETIRNANGNIVGAKVTIYRKDWDKPFEWETSMSEFNKGMSNWKAMPEFMIKKVAIAQGFRLAFPNEIGGLPYIREELEAEEPPTPMADNKSPIHSTKQEEKKPEKMSIQHMQYEISKMLFEMYGTEEAAADELERLSTWTNKEGKTMQGKRDASKLNDKENAKGQSQTSVIYHQLKKAYNEWLKENEVIHANSN